MTIALST